MDPVAPHLDLTLQLPRDMYYQLVHTLRGSLPPPVTDAPEDHVRRDNDIIAKVASLLPANADEANLAGLYLIASAQAHECLRIAREYPADATLARHFTAQSANMMRQVLGFRSLLLRVQAAREKREADAAALDKAAWTEHCAIGLMAEALGRPQPAPIPEPPPPPEAPQPGDDFATLSEADQYAIMYPRRAALIRKHGGIPPNCTFGPPEPDLAHDIATGTSPILRALDSPAEPAPAPA